MFRNSITTCLFLFIAGTIFCQSNRFYSIKINPTKLISNELTISFELKNNSNGYEVELGYIYPTSDPGKPIPSIGIENLGIPLLRYSGASLNLYYKYYFSNHLYIGGHFLYKYMYFNNLWLYTGGMSDEGENTLCSQSQNVFGVGFRGGALGIIHGFIIEPYYGVGVKGLSVNTVYDSYVKNGYSHSGTPPHTLSKDNGFYWQLYINLGVKIGFGWPYKKAFPKNK
jgi:hypothetical protein